MADEIIVHAWNPNKIYLLLITAFLFGLGIVMMMLALETDFSPPFFVVVLGLIIPPILIFVSIFYYVKKDPFTIDNSGLRGKNHFIPWSQVISIHEEEYKLRYSYGHILYLRYRVPGLKEGTYKSLALGKRSRWTYGRREFTYSPGYAAVIALAKHKKVQVTEVDN
jgi:hypothetical protein